QGTDRFLRNSWTPAFRRFCPSDATNPWRSLSVTVGHEPFGGALRAPQDPDPGDTSKSLELTTRRFSVSCCLLHLASCLSRSSHARIPCCSLEAGRDGNHDRAKSILVRTLRSGIEAGLCLGLRADRGSADEIGIRP